MMNLVDTDRLPQQPLDKAASSILTDRSIAYARASWQQCTCCEEWIEEENIEVCACARAGSTLYTYMLVPTTVR